MGQIKELWVDLADWSQKTFGNDWERGPIGPLKHLKLEVDEAINTPNNLTEYADCLILLFDATRRAHFNLEELIDAAIAKMIINKKRTYPKPEKDSPVHHKE